MNPTRITRRRFQAGLLATSVLACSALRAQPRIDAMRIVVGYPAGGSVDIVGRKLAEKLTGLLARQVVVENKVGAAGRLAIDELKRSPADGTVMLITPASTVTLYPHVFRQLAYDPFADLAPISTVCGSGFALAVGPRVPDTVTNLESFTQWCRSNPAMAQCGNPGAGSMPHLMALLMARELRAELAHIPYRGGLPAMQAAAAGEIAAALSTEASARALQQAGKLRVLATTWAARSPFFPQTASFGEQGVERMKLREWFGAFMPANTPAALLQATAEALRVALQAADVRETWDKTALVVEASTPAQLAAAMRSEHDFWGPLVKASGFTPET